MAEEIKNETREQRLEKTTFNRASMVSASEIDPEMRMVKMSFASEKPVERWDWNGPYDEVLRVDQTSADLSRMNNGGALLSDHNREKQIGVVEKAWIGDDRRAHAIVRFSDSAAGQQEFNDVQKGIRRNVSFAYKIRSADTAVGQKGQKDVVTATDWEVLEISLVSVPADASVGVGRSEELGTQPVEQVVKVKLEVDEKSVNESLAKIESIRGSKMENEVVAQAEKVLSREDEILEIGRKFKADERLTNQFALDPNKSVNDFRAALAEQFRAEKPSTAIVPGLTHLDLTEKQKERFSVTKAILAAADNNWKNAGFERECSEEISKRLNKETSGFFLPSDIQLRDLSATGGTSSGGALVATEHMPQSFIDLLRSKMVMLASGVSVLSGLVGNPSIPRQDGAATGYWLTPEGTAPPESQLVVAQLGLSPKTCGAKTDFTRQLLIQGTHSIDLLVLSDLSAVLARTIDAAIIQGDSSGSSGQPDGILNTTGVDTVAQHSTNFSWIDAVAFETAVAEDNAPQATSFICRPTLRGTLKVIEKGSAGYPIYLCGDDNRMNNYPVDVTTQMPADTIMFGDWSTVILGEWGVLEIEANRYGTGFAAGNIEVRGLHMVDVAVRYPQALKKLEAFVSDKD